MCIYGATTVSLYDDQMLEQCVSTSHVFDYIQASKLMLFQNCNQASALMYCKKNKKKRNL